MVSRGTRDTARPIFEAVTLGQLDRWLYVPEVVGDEEFHRYVTEILEEWSARWPHYELDEAGCRKVTMSNVAGAWYSTVTPMSSAASFTPLAATDQNGSDA